MQLMRLERPIIAYPLCFDDNMKTCLENEGIPHENAFGYCRFIGYEKKATWDKRLSFPNFGFGKYERIGVEVYKKPIDDINATIKPIEEAMKTGWVFLHYDGYYCPWDHLQKLRKWHSSHSVIVTGIDPKRGFVVSDAFYDIAQRTIPFSVADKACKFYIAVRTDGYSGLTAEYIHNSQSGEKNNASVALERFLEDFRKDTETDPPKEIFSDEWIKQIEKAYMTRHYLYLFYRKLYEESKSPRYGTIAAKYLCALQYWKECVVQSHKGARRKDESLRRRNFAESFRKALETEQMIEGLFVGKTSYEIILLRPSKAEENQTAVAWDLSMYFNARACKKSRRDILNADVTGEGEFIMPKSRKRKQIHISSACYQVHLGGEKDHIRCEGQTLSVPNGIYRGVSFLLCSEWGRSQVLLEIQGEKQNYLTEYVANDFTCIGQDSVLIGSSYLIGEKRNVKFQKYIYFQSVCFFMPNEDVLKKIILPNCDSLHVFGAVLWK